MITDILKLIGSLAAFVLACFVLSENSDITTIKQVLLCILGCWVAVPSILYAAIKAIDLIERE